MKQVPPPLNTGDRIGIFLPSSPVKEPFRSNGLRALEQLGYIPVEVENILSKEPAAEFLARSPESGFRDLQRLFKAPDIKALWAARGGYGSNLLLPLLQRLEVSEPKMVIGSSDVAYLLWYLLERFNMVVFYGPTVYSSLADARFNPEQLEKILSGRYSGTVIPGKTLAPGSVKGFSTGGCMTNFVSLLGTRWLPETDRRILLLEDVGERPFRLDRMFWQLEQAGIFRKVRGLLLGRFPNCFKDGKEKNDFLDRVRFHLKDYDFPVVYDLPLGHGDDLHTLPLGIEVEIDSAGFKGVMLI